MALTLNLVQDFPPIQGQAPKVTTAIVTGDYVSLKNCHRAWVIFSLTQGTGHATQCSLMRATAVAPTNATAVTESVRIWENEDVAANDTLVRQTDAANVTVTADVKNKMVVMEIDPEVLAAGYDCIAGKTSASGAADNFVSMVYVLFPRYAQATPPTAITD